MLILPGQMKSKAVPFFEQTLNRLTRFLLPLEAIKNNSWRKSRPRVYRYSVAVVSVILTAFVKSFIQSTTTVDVPYLMFPIAILISAWYGGIGPGIVATGLSVLVINPIDQIATFSFLNPFSQWGVLNLAFIIEGYVISRIIDNFHASKFVESQKQAELKDSEQRFKLLLESSGEGMYGIDTHGNCTFMNQSASRMLGLKPDEVIGRNMHELIHRSKKDGSPYLKKDCPIMKAIRAGKGVRIDDEIFLKKKGHTFPVRYSSSPIIENDTIKGAVVSFNDITKRKKIVAQLQLSQTRLKALFESNIVGIVIEHLDGRIIEANNAFLALTGYNRDDLKKNRLSWKKLTPKEYLPQTLRAAEIIKEKGMVKTWEKEFIRKDGTRVPVLVGAVMTNPTEDEVIGVALDITERKKLEQRKDNFVALASHELKTPLTSLKVYTQILEKTLGSQKRPLEHIKKMDQQLNRLNDLVNDLLDVSKIQAGKMSFIRTEFDFDTLVEETVTDMQQADPFHSFTILEKSAATVCADKDRLSQVITNFLINASKYSPNTKDIIIKSHKNAENIFFSVQDFGIGIDKSEHDKIFNQFYQISNPKGKTFPGLGLGLFISSQIIKRHGGRMWVESETDKGSTFYFSLPFVSKCE